ncbi:Oidioi.mRNA.OKI2018_I69.chr2.g4479.t1.cds [Oikopleura dioica]|uniref:Oidioi.mRNA.OKI2018_I69.chr2.g4479.t1.cds n=1 Tax=Oikopleura dioica TaxID=34765 RepID=A0ABN7T0X0_OIKDI|nr:Oidioi.mRNA.OKI2018_I69.chr2.g4479.t1.cds [Oikopleura dioica]
MGSWCLACSYFMMNSMFIAILVIVPKKTASSSEESAICVEESDSSGNSTAVLTNSTVFQDEKDVIEMSEDEKSLLVSAFNIGYVLTQLAGPWLATRIGFKKVLLISTLFSGILTLGFPVILKTSVTLAIISRIVAGALSGPAIPVTRESLSGWAPSSEIGRMVSLQIIGCPVGIVSAQFFGGLLSRYSWQLVFYLSGLMCLIWAGIWQFFVFPTPEQDKRCSKEETDYIITKRNASCDRKTAKKVPWGEILESIPFWALVIGQLCVQWTIFLILAKFPEFLSVSYGLDVFTIGIIGTTLALSLIASGFFGFISDHLAKKKSPTFSRKAISTTSSMGIALCLVLLTRTACMFELNIAFALLMAFSVGIGSFLALEPNSMDLAPDYSGIVQGLVNTVGNCAGFGTD